MHFFLMSISLFTVYFSSGREKQLYFSLGKEKMNEKPKLPCDRAALKEALSVLGDIEKKTEDTV